MGSVPLAHLSSVSNQDLETPEERSMFPFSFISQCPSWPEGTLLFPPDNDQSQRMLGFRATKHVILQVRKEKARVWFLLRFKENVVAEPSQRPPSPMLGFSSYFLSQKVISMWRLVPFSVHFSPSPSAFLNIFLCKCILGELSLLSVTLSCRKKT